MKFKIGNVDRFLDQDLDLDNRIIWIGSVGDTEGSENGTDYACARRTIKNLIILDGRAPNGDEPIYIYMNSPGGDYYHALGIYDAIRACKNEVKVMVFGQAFSAASIILQAADERLLSPLSRILIHYGSEYYEGHSRDMVRFGEESKRDQRVLEDIYLERIQEKYPQFKREDLQKRMNFDCWLSATEAIKLGLADGIIGA